MYVYKEVNEMQMDGVRPKGYTGKWSGIDESYYKGEKVVLLENDHYGDETCYLLVYENLKVICETHDDILTTIRELTDGTR